MATNRNFYVMIPITIPDTVPDGQVKEAAEEVAGDIGCLIDNEWQNRTCPGLIWGDTELQPVVPRS